MPPATTRSKTEPKLSRPVQVAEAIKDWVVEQGLQAGDRLPGEAELPGAHPRRYEIDHRGPGPPRLVESLPDDGLDAIERLARIKPNSTGAKKNWADLGEEQLTALDGLAHLDV